jgi:S1-C subfamily serine protease
MRKIFWEILAIFIIGIFGGIFADQIFWPYFIERPLFYQYSLEQNPVYLTERKEVIVQENTALKDSIEKVANAVIGVETTNAKGIVLKGSGLILTSDGLVITLASLVPQGSNFQFLIEGKTVNFQVLKRDLKENLALIKVEKNNLPAVGFANLERLRLGERAFLVGVNHSLSGGLAVNEGIVKSFDKDSIQTSISDSNELAGSPLFDITGQVLGLNVINSNGAVSAIPITKVKAFAGF